MVMADDVSRVHGPSSSQVTRRASDGDIHSNPSPPVASGSRSEERELGPGEQGTGLVETSQREPDVDRLASILSGDVAPVESPGELDRRRASLLNVQEEGRRNTVMSREPVPEVLVRSSTLEGLSPEEQRLRELAERNLGQNAYATYPDPLRVRRQHEDGSRWQFPGYPNSFASYTYPHSYSRNSDRSPSAQRDRTPVQPLPLPPDLMPTQAGSDRPANNPELGPFPYASLTSGPSSAASESPDSVLPGYPPHHPGQRPPVFSPPPSAQPDRGHSEPYQVYHPGSISSASTSPLPGDFAPHRSAGNIYQPMYGSYNPYAGAGTGQRPESIAGVSSVGSPPLSPRLGYRHSIGYYPQPWLSPGDDESGMGPPPPPPGMAAPVPDRGNPYIRQGVTSGMTRGQIPRQTSFQHHQNFPPQYHPMPDSNAAYMTMHQPQEGFGTPSLPSTTFSSPSMPYQPFSSPSQPYSSRQMSWFSPQTSVSQMSSSGPQYGPMYSPHVNEYGQPVATPRGYVPQPRPSQIQHFGNQAVLSDQQNWDIRGQPPHGITQGGARGHPTRHSMHAVPDSASIPTETVEPTHTRNSIGGGLVMTGLSTSLDEISPEAQPKLQRKAYHPAPPTNRSDWVMWVGNVPGNATHEEMWKFFNAPLNPEELPPGVPPKQWLGVSSIFLISRSSCAFVNLKSPEDLTVAIAYFNGRSLRPWDPRCPKLVCRIRKTDDDLRAGVGAQRGAGIHTRYVAALKEKEKEDKEEEDRKGKEKEGERKVEPPLESAGSDESALAATLSPVTSSMPPSPAVLQYPPEGEGRRRESVTTPAGGITPAAFAAWQHDRSTSGTHSFASTNSSFLARNFPKRYFILKSLTQEELDKSVKTGMWATQAHNEPILDQAFRTSPEVILIFGANRQGGFFGYALMRSAIRPRTREHRSISGSSKGENSLSGDSKSSGSKSSVARGSYLSPTNPDIIEEEQTNEGEGDEPARPSLPHATSSDVQPTMASPGQMTPGDEARFPRTSPLHPPGESHSGPAVLGPSEGDRSLIREATGRAMTLDPKELDRTRRQRIIQSASTQTSFILDEEAPARAIRENAGEETQDNDDPGEGDNDGVARRDMVEEKITPEVEKQVNEPSTEEKYTGGTPFKIEWVKIGRLPFHRVKHLRNPWNQDKEIKVSRDGTELEPSIGAALLAEWEKIEEVASPIHSLASPQDVSQAGLETQS